ncbi:CRISPR-associated protein Cmr3 [Marinitoga sp. 1135]|uniref:CRISPR type III-B/RAMP module-associated protein Cmr3 n=1 Tax=Marinitoga piezophila (strain DSM 14283 / JCM 11233 / KA3) TaxID=443254 RepID=H2J4S1_MARPK|nr:MULTISPECIES: type III-B CRISPR module-associated protein Cmr3 [Marinitoga]AEX84856.1 CRISPR type III-B/RAMP module-associated protein Cmr3 [Marinitoga piezophila KA3]APT75363.1 CRISPR-associated protein Cmr3 [Marinitoga sp. 1137]NUU95093.1 CRISPR-associated protein Cmr3 [Marinitoga sp. 1135]
MKKIKTLFIKPVDWVGFRKSKTFSHAEETIFPNPKTFYGAIMTAYMRKKNLTQEEIEQIIKDKKLKIIGPFLTDSESNIYFRMPAIIKQNDITKEFYKGEIDETFTFNLNGKELYGIKYKSMRNLKEPEKTYISLNELEELKKGNLKISNDNSEIYFKEEKIGIALENRKAMEGMLYSYSYFRFIDDAGFAFFIERDELNILNEIEIITLGTKGKMAKIEIKEIETSIFDPIIDTQKGLLLLTPAYFEDGVKPIFDSNIIAIANYKPETIGYWDLKNNHPGEQFKVVPSGSVYVIKGDFEKENYKINFTDKYDEYNFGKYIEIKI